MLERAPEIGRIYVLLRSKSLRVRARPLREDRQHVAGVQGAARAARGAALRVHRRQGRGRRGRAERAELDVGGRCAAAAAARRGPGRALRGARRFQSRSAQGAGLERRRHDERRGLRRVERSRGAAAHLDVLRGGQPARIDRGARRARVRAERWMRSTPSASSPMRARRRAGSASNTLHASTRRTCAPRSRASCANGAPAIARSSSRTWRKRRMREELKQALVDEGMERARRLGWPNTYTYTKSLAESLLLRRAGRLRFSILRPSIVESAFEFPFPGWNESFNGSAPLAYVMGSWFRMIPAKPDAPFDVIPVDMVCKAMSIAGAALLQGVHAQVYHIGTSDRHRCSVGRAAELIVLAHRRYLSRTGTHAQRARLQVALGLDPGRAGRRVRGAAQPRVARRCARGGRAVAAEARAPHAQAALRASTARTRSSRRSSR